MHIITVPFPKEYAEEAFRNLFQKAVQEYKDTGLPLIVSREVSIEFLDTEGKSWVLPADYQLKVEDILQNRWDLLKRAFDLHTIYICKEKRIVQLDRYKGILENYPPPTTIRISFPTE